MGFQILTEGSEQALQLAVIEAEQTVEAAIQADVGTDIEAAGHIVQRQRRDAGDEQPRQTAAALSGGPLEHREDIAEKAAAVRQIPIGVLAEMGQQIVGEVVVFVDEQIERPAQMTQFHQQPLQCRRHGRLLTHPRRHVLRQVLRMAQEQAVDLIATMGLERGFQMLRLGAHHREIEAQAQVLAALRGRIGLDPGLGKEFIEGLGPFGVVVALHHRLQQTLAEAARADQEQKAPGLLQ
ncbi:hypothetical protein Atep_23660 [Allochromatium tepidum]|uniref:Uncharacterized protein n=1 Tax=Allochromatium tepidum TaxID=553982 RepID=A0ABM7QP37_9GAMM|nr:hypothetical protein [Allochromatium tepidum]BCU07689.1 hypothetical protein Atep_23660 [Allochromatium tepidum]